MSHKSTTDVIWFLFALHFIGGGVSAQKCSYFREEGQCTLFRECVSAQDLWSKAKSDSNSLRDLQTLTRACSYTRTNPKVCCPPEVSIAAVSSGPFAKIQSVSTSKDQDLSSHPHFRLLPSIEECSNTPLSLRIIGGKTAPLGSYPWIARVGYTILRTQRVVFGCAGSIITDRTILTAAHCLDNLGSQLKPSMVRLAEHDVTTNPDCFQQECVTHQDFEIDRVILHPGYQTNSKHNDIAIIHIKGRIPFNEPYIQPVCLPFAREYSLSDFPTDLSHKKSIVAGFGKTKWNRAAGSSILQHVELTIVPNAACQNEYARSSRIHITSTQLCAGGELGKDSCDGDSGGPLMINYHSPHSVYAKLVQVGVISYGPKQCGESGLPGVYTRITEFRRWILDNLI